MKSPIITIMTNVLDDSIAFYTNVLGFSLQSRIDLPDVTLQFLQHETVTLELVSLKVSPEFTVGSAVVLTFLVDSFTDLFAKMSAAGIEHPLPFTLPSGVEMLRFTDPSGVPISFVIESSISH